ncbi:MAG: exo-alpha-sialidase [Lysobacterales bacterium]|nr:MAG: exo-alpha-sialidase [Xanthomonadales bacterium]
MRFLFLALAMTIQSAHAEDGLKLFERIDHIGSLAREPMVVEHPSGALFLSGFASQVTGTDWTVPPFLWRSDDQGKTWQAVDVGSSEDGAQGNSDVDLTVGPDGTIYFITMGFNRSTKRGTHVAMGVSHDVGATWNWQFLSRNDLDDRPWVAVSPDNVAHAIWNDGKGVRHFVSTDSGKAWQERARIHDKGGSSHLAVGADNRVAVRIGSVSASGQVFHEGVDLIAVSQDGGQSWQHHAPPGEVKWVLPGGEGMFRWVDPLAWGPDGSLYHLWSEGETVWLGWSRDFGASWDKRVISREEGIAFYPYMTSNEAGDLAATWFVSNEQGLTARLASIHVQGETLQVHTAAPFTPLSWQDTTEVRKPDTAGEYVPAIRLSSGEIGVATPIQDAHENRYGFSWWVFAMNR